MTYNYDCNSGALLSVKDANDAAANRSGTVYQYEATAGRLHSISYPDAGQTSYSYPSATEVDTSVLATHDPTITSQAILDSFGRPHQQIKAGVSSETTYDANGRVNCVTNLHLSSSSSTDGTACITTYDGLDRPTLETEQDGNTLIWSYQGNTVTSTDETGNSWQRINDAFGEQTKVTEPGNLQTLYSYDALGNLLTIAQVGVPSVETPRMRSFTYDSLSRLVQTYSPESGWTCYGTTGGNAPNGSNCTSGYDPNGNLLAKTTPAPNSVPGSGQAITTIEADVFLFISFEIAFQCFPIKFLAVSFHEPPPNALTLCLRINSYRTQMAVPRRWIA